MIMMKLGSYRFSIATAAYQQLQRSTAYRWRGQDRLQRLPAQQYVGPGTETLSLSGLIYPEYQVSRQLAAGSGNNRGGSGNSQHPLKQLDAMRDEANLGQALMLVDGTGRPWGRWVINQIEETRTVFFEDGTPRHIEFRMQLTRYGEDFDAIPN